MERRRDIDGLRAIAILPVVLYHAHVPSISGGFVGVDVFFVISGYLITGIIRSELQAGSFSLVNFYERRARRILPALFFMIAASILAAVIIMRPEPLVSFAKSVWAAALFSSNFWFWRTARNGYFDTSSDYLPLLHTWSLAVEEQFYLIFPLVMIALWRFSRTAVAGAVVIGSIGSLVLALIAMARFPQAAFYLAPLRAWELGIGASLALLPQPELRARWMRELLAMCGLMMIAGPVFFYSYLTSFPGLTAVPPCLGAAALLLAGARGKNVTSSLLSSAPLVGIGIISYSLYLSHWPILSFLRLRYETLALSPVATALAICAAFAMAIFSWAFVERPFLNRRHLRTRQVFVLSGSAIAASLAAGFIVSFSEGFPQRIPAEALAFAAAAEDVNPVRVQCMERYPPSLCELGDAAVKQSTFALWGDSYADAVYPGIDHASRAKGVRGFFASAASCPPLIGVGEKGSACREFNDEMIKFLHARPEIETVILIARWPVYETGGRPPWGGTPRNPAVLVDDESPDPQSRSNAVVFMRGIKRTIDELIALDRRVVIIAEVPEMGWSVPHHLYLQAYWGDPLPPIPSLADLDRRNAGVLAAFEAVEKPGKVRVVRVAPALCQSGCPVMYRNRSAYWDDNHFTAFYSEALAPMFEALVLSAVVKPPPQLRSSSAVR
ncbi:MAG: acyltransferase family protein [Hyphomicrobium sp.]